MFKRLHKWFEDREPSKLDEEVAESKLYPEAEKNPYPSAAILEIKPVGRRPQELSDDWRDERPPAA